MKRRNLLLGGAALLFGSGATSFAAVNSEVDPTADLQVLADRKLVVRSIKPDENGAAGSPNRSADISLEDSGSLTDINNTARSSLPTGNTLNQTSEQNSDFGFNAAFESNRGGGGTTGKFSDIFLIENLASGARDIQISYKNKDQSVSGYGNDAADAYGNGSSSLMDPQEVQQIYTFQIGFDSDVTSNNQTGDRISPPPGDTSDNHQGTTVTLGAGGLLGVQLAYDTSSNSNYNSDKLAARVNEVATDNIFGASGAYVDMLDTIFVQDVTP